jgi:N-acetyl sugar amidotransferase
MQLNQEEKQNQLDKLQGHLPLVQNNTRIKCQRCLYDEDTPSISFDANGICNYCKLHDQLDLEYPIGEAGMNILRQVADKIRRENKRKKFDVVVGVSGGCDSSYLVYIVKEVMGLRPLAVHFDNTWNSKIAVENIHNVLKKLDVELFTYVVDNEEYDDIYRAFMKAGVLDVDGPTDIGLATTLYRAAEKYGINYIFIGHSFRTEGVAPLGWNYVDGKYIQSVTKKYGTYKLKTFPNLWISDFIRWAAINQINRLRPLYYVNYQKEEVKKFLSQEFGWQWYGGHHLENRFTAFCHSYLFPQRFGIDNRVNGYSALIRSDQMAREEGIKLMQEPPQYDPEIVEMVKKRLGFSDEEFEELMNLPKKTYKDFVTYKHTFEKLRPLFWMLYKMDLVPKSFYIKYTSKNNI